MSNEQWAGSNELEAVGWKLWAGSCGLGAMGWERWAGSDGYVNRNGMWDEM